MIKIDVPTPGRIELTVEGLVDRDAMHTTLDQLLAAAEGRDSVTMLYRIPAFTFPSPDSLLVKMGYLPKLFDLMKKLDRVALMSDSAWLRTAAEIEGAVIPGMAIKSFTMDAEAQALAWLGDDPTEDVPI